jgi:hypothetical protein
MWIREAASPVYFRFENKKPTELIPGAYIHGMG